MFRAITNNRTVLFWTLQIAGWLAYAVLNYLIGIEINELPGDYFIPSLLYSAGGITITLGLRQLFRRIWELRPLHILIVGGLGALLASAVFTGFRSWVHIWFYGVHHWANLSFIDYFNVWDLTFSLYAIGTWSGMYFGIRYYRTVQEQKEGLLRATSMAHEAQLKMLRYQLNPHFLFNTLNAISTLVLEQNHTAANEMLTRLSAFLRHSLHSDPMLKVNLRQELEALQLYLRIEQVRFEDQLHVKLDIEPQAYTAMVPGLLLQPLIENAIKHAIAANEEGGAIGIAARVEDGKLCLRVTDTGPGPRGRNPLVVHPPSGVGLSNTRERLSVLYGPRHELKMEKLEPSGLSVTICIPFENSDQEQHPGPDRR